MSILPNLEQKPPKCLLTRCFPPNYVDSKDPPTKKKPFSTILEHVFNHTVDLILPEEVCELVRQKIESESLALRYQRVNMSLLDVISGDFFEYHVKQGNVTMLSQARPGVDDLFSLHDGTLHLELSRPTYERCGLTGQPIPDGTRKHVPSRFAIDLNLRLPSMRHGKKGFNRIVYAFKNVLNHSVTWLFYDPESQSQSQSQPGEKTKAKAALDAHAPLQRSIKMESLHMKNTMCPDMKANIEILQEESNAIDLYEWISLISLNSSRIIKGDDLDPYLSRYEVSNLHLMEKNVDDGIESQNLMRLRWHGFIPSDVITKLWIETRRVVFEKEAWGAMSVGCFGGEQYSLLEVGKQGTLVWECPQRL